MTSPHDRDPGIVAHFLDNVSTVIETLEAIVEDRGLLADLDPATRQRLLTAAGRASKPDKMARRKLARAHRRLDKVSRRNEEEALLARTGIRQLRENPVFLTPRRRLLHGEDEQTPEQAPEPIGEVDEARTAQLA